MTHGHHTATTRRGPQRVSRAAAWRRARSWWAGVLSWATTTSTRTTRPKRRRHAMSRWPGCGRSGRSWQRRLGSRLKGGRTGRLDRLVAVSGGLAARSDPTRPNRPTSRQTGEYGPLSGPERPETGVGGGEGAGVAFSSDACGRRPTATPRPSPPAGSPTARIAPRSSSRPTRAARRAARPRLAAPSAAAPPPPPLPRRSAASAAVGPGRAQARAAWAAMASSTRARRSSKLSAVSGAMTSP